MILYGSQKLTCRKRNVVGFAVDEENALYVSLDIYKQAILLFDRFEGDVTLFREKMKFPARQIRAYEYFLNHAPDPLTMLAPFVQIIDGREVMEDMKEISGILHCLSKMINFEAFSKVAKELRNGIDVSYLDVADYKEEQDEIMIQEFRVDKSVDELAARITSVLERFSTGLREDLKEALSGMKLEFTHDPVNININGMPGERHRGMSEQEELDEFLPSDATQEDLEDAFEEDPFAAFNALCANALDEAKENGEWNASPARGAEKDAQKQTKPVEIERCTIQEDREEEQKPKELTAKERLLALYGGASLDL